MVKCTIGCFEKAALGKSGIVKGQSEAAIEASLKAYKAGTQNKAGMGALMKGQVAAFSDADIGQLADFVAGSGNTVSLSAYALDSTTVGTGTGFLITDVYAAANNSDGQYAIVEVVPMKQIYRS